MLLRSLLVVLACLSLAFAVTPAQAAQVQLAWDAPTQANGTPIPNLAGYKLYYGSQSSQYQTTIPVGMTTTYTVTNLSAGQTYYFAAKAYDSTGTESAFSNEVSVTLPTNTPSVTPPTTTPVGGIIPQQQMQVVSVDSQELVGENGAMTNVIDGKPATFWHTEWYQRTAPLPHTLVLDLGGQYQVDGFRYLPRQDGLSNGTIAGYQFYVSTDGVTWGTAGTAGTLAADTSEKTVRFTAKPGRFVRLVALSEINGYPYTSAAELNIFGTAVASTPTSSLIPQQQLHVVSVDSQELVGENGAMTNVIDGKPATFWHTEWYQRTAPLPHTLVLDLGGQYQVDGFRYLPRQDGLSNGTIAGYQFYVSTDGVTWGTAGTAGTLAADTSEKTVRFTAKPGRFVRLVALSEINGYPYTSAAELNIFGTAVTSITPLPSVTVSTSAAAIASGQSAILTWSATNATSCAAAWTASTATAGSQSVKPTATTTYTMNCTGAGGTAAASTIVTVTAKPSVTVSTSAAAIASGQSAILTWSATNATSCAAAWTASTATAGSQSVKPTATTTYTMNCTGAGGTAAASTIVTVTAKPSVTVSTSAAAIASGQSAILTWSATNATSCAAAWTASTATAGSQSVKPTATTTYTMNCTGAGGTAAASTIVTVTAKPSVTVSTSAAAIASGQSAILTWSATNATSCAAAWTASTATAGSQSVKPTATTTYTMNCTGAGGTAAASTTVSINTLVSSLIPQQQLHVVSVDSQELVGENGAMTNVIDGKPATFWHTEWYQRTAPLPHTLVLDLGGQYQVDGFRYLPRQDGLSNGTIAGYQFYVSTDGVTWGTAGTAGTLAADTSEKTVRFTAKPGRFVRLVALSEINGYPYTSAAELNIFGTAVASTPTSSLIPQQQLHVVSVDSQELVGENGAMTNVIDGKPATFWHTEWYQRTAPLPHTLVLDLGGQYQVDGFRYLPRQDGLSNGTIAGYQFYVSTDGVTWGTAGTAGTLAADTSEKTVRFTAKPGRFVRLVALSEINGYPYTSAAELNIFGAAVPSSTTTTSSLVTQPITTSPVMSSASTPSAVASRSSAQTAPVTGSAATSPSPAPTMAASQNTTFGQTQGLQHVGRWFTYNGQYIFLIGYDAQELAANPSLDYNAALDLFVQYRLNKVRIWIGYCYWNPTFLAPWMVANGKFDLDTWNPVFWQRMKSFVAAAQSRNIMVEATIIAANNLDGTDDWLSAAWNTANNVNGVFTANAQGIFSPEFWDMTHAEVSTSRKLLVDYQEALVDKTVLELGAFPNVYLELANEFPVRNANVDLVYPWQLIMAQRINASMASLVTAHAHEFVGDHTKGVQYYWDQPAIDVLDFHFSTQDPGTISSLLHPVQAHGKVMQQNQGRDPYLDLAAATQAAWGWVLSGGHYAMYEDDSSRVGSAGWRSGAQRLNVLHTIMDTVNWWQMSPVDAAGNEYDALIMQGPAGSNYQVLANPGVDYLAYFWGTQSTASVSMSVPSGSYDYYWYDPRDGVLLMSGSASPSGQGSMSISSPRTSTWDAATGLVLVLKHR